MANQIAAVAKGAQKVKGSKPVAHGVGRRKSCVARVWLRRGSGVVTVNGLDVNKYFDTAVDRSNAVSPFVVYPTASGYDVQVNVSGGGKTGQSDAVKLGIARAFLEQDATTRPVFRKNNLLTVDSRVKERKKYGRRGARRGFQFVKR